MKTRTDGGGGSGEAVVVGGGGMRGEGGWRERERESGSGRESKPALCSTRSFTSFLPPFQFDTSDSLARCQTTRRLKKTKVMKGALLSSRNSFLFLTTKTIISPAFFSSALRILGIQKRKIAMIGIFFFRT